MSPALHCTLLMAEMRLQASSSSCLVLPYTRLVLGERSPLG
jgi:hypothetical protein